MKHRSQSSTYRRLVKFFRRYWAEEIGSHGAAALARTAERSLVMTTYDGRVFVTIPGREPLELPNV